jgi:hypothetical protein
MKVSTTNLSPALDDAHSRYGTIDRGEMESGPLAALLTEFARLDTNLNWEHEPAVRVHTPRGDHVIRTERGHFQLYDGRDTSQPGVDLALADLIAVLEERTPAPIEPGGDDFVLQPTRGRHRFEKIGAAILLCLGLGLNGWGVLQLFRSDRTPKESATPLADAAKAARIAGKLAGTYLTGHEAGERMIVLEPNGSATFHLLYRASDGALKPTGSSSDRYQFGLKRDGTVVLMTEKKGLISILADGTLSAWGDRYRRSAALAK